MVLVFGALLFFFFFRSRLDDQSVGPDCRPSLFQLLEEFPRGMTIQPVEDSNRIGITLASYRYKDEPLDKEAI